MKKKIKYVFLMLCFCLFYRDGTTQNLVPNPSFEQYTECPTSEGNIDFAFPWFSSGITPDFFSICSNSIIDFSVPSNIVGYQLPHHGNAYAGFFAGTKGSINGREYLSVELLDSLRLDRKYLLRFYVSLADSSTAGLSTLGIHLSSEKFFSANGFIYDSSHIQKTLKPAVVDNNMWIELSDTIKASGGEKFITIGNFVPDSLIDYYILDSTQDIFYGLAYYYIDDVLVVDVDSLEFLTTDVKTPKEEILTTKVQVFPNPMQEYVSIKVTNAQLNGAELIITDLLGRTVAKQTLLQELTTFSTQGWANGMYVWSLVEDGRLVRSGKLVKE
jgi:OOP family OmpA-OmpF porin